MKLAIFKYIVSLSHATAKLLLPLTEIMDLEANLNSKYVL